VRSLGILRLHANCAPRNSRCAQHDKLVGVARFAAFPHNG
jgi:hypothetical protein